MILQFLVSARRQQCGAGGAAAGVAQPSADGAERVPGAGRSQHGRAHRAALRRGQVHRLRPEASRQNPHLPGVRMVAHCKRLKL